MSESPGDIKSESLGGFVGIGSMWAWPSNAQQANTIGASRNSVITKVKIAAPALLPTPRGSQARKAAYSGQLAIAVTLAASRACVKPCTIQKDRATIVAARIRPQGNRVNVIFW